MHVHVYSEEQYERLEKVYKRKCAVPHIGELRKCVYTHVHVHVHVHVHEFIICCRIAYDHTY